MEDQKPSHTLGQDEATASVRPADARYNRVKFTPQQLAEIREQEIEEATVALLEKRKAEEEANQKTLDESGYVNPTKPVEETPTSRAFEKVYGKGSGDPSEADQAADTSGEQEAGQAPTGPADDTSASAAKKTAAARKG